MGNRYHRVSGFRELSDFLWGWIHSPSTSLSTIESPVNNAAANLNKMVVSQNRGTPI